MAAVMVASAGGGLASLGQKPSGLPRSFWQDLCAFVTTPHNSAAVDIVGATDGILVGKSNTLTMDVSVQGMASDNFAYVDITIAENYPEETLLSVDVDGQTLVKVYKASLNKAFDDAIKFVKKSVVMPKKKKSGSTASTVSLPKMSTELVDFLLVLLQAALEGPANRRSSVIAPWPSVRDPDQPSTLLIDPALKDTAQVNAVLDYVGCPAQHSRAKKGKLADVLHGNHKAAPLLLKWVLETSMPTDWTALSRSRQLIFMGTTRQFFLVSEDAAKEAAFSAAAAKYGTTFAFHGSALHNFHAIVRGGLKNYSNTALMANAAVHGSGIYLSRSSGLSMQYSGAYGSAGLTKARACQLPSKDVHTCAGSAGEFIFNPSGWTVLALCEVVTSPKLNRSTSMIWTMPKNDHCATRILFVYPPNSFGPSIDLNSGTYDGPIQALINHYRP